MATTSFALHQLSVGTDFAFPLGSYVVESAGVGDATGGVVTFTTDYVGPHLFSLEGASGVAISVVTHDLLVTWLPRVGVAGTGFVAFLNMGLALTRQVSEGRDMFPRYPISVSTPGADPVRTQLEFDSNQDTVVYRIAFWGYYWDFRSRQTPTGPIRPI